MNADAVQIAVNSVELEEEVGPARLEVLGDGIGYRALEMAGRLRESGASIPGDEQCVALGMIVRLWDAVVKHGSGWLVEDVESMDLSSG